MLELRLSLLYKIMYTSLQITISSILLFVVSIYQVDCFEWKERPNLTTHAKINSLLQVYWKYNLSANEKLYEIQFFQNGKKMYGKNMFGGGFVKPWGKYPNFGLTGDRLVTYHNSNITSGDEGKYCLKITYTLINDTGSVSYDKENCTLLHPFAFPYITYITSNLTTKQGKSRSLQCNASGLPKPGIIWIKVQSNLKNTTVTYKNKFWLNITGKMSGGKYCCHVSNRYGKDTKCSYIKVTEYQPVRTVFTSRNDNYTVKNTAFQVSCKADASPRARYLIKDGEKIVGNSTDETFNITRQGEGNFINISCTPGNAYGKGDTKYLLLPIYESPVIVNPSNTNIMMTTNNITLRCNATGNPKPDIIWRYDNNVTRNNKGLDGELNVIYECCENRTFLYYCQASNRVMATKEYLITVKAIRYNCRVEEGTAKSNDDRNLIPSADNDLAMMVAVIVCVLVLVIVIIVLACIIVSMKNNHSKRQMIRRQSQSSRNQYIEESPYGDPVDAIQVKNPNYTSASNADYATVEEIGYKRRSDVNRLPKDEISDMPLVTLPEGISDNYLKTTNVSGNISSPIPSEL